MASMMLRGMPFEDMMGWAYRAMFSRDFRKDMLEKPFGEFGADVFQTGLIPAATGIDLSGSLAEDLPPFVELPLQLAGVRDPETPTSQLLTNIVEFAAGRKQFVDAIPHLAMRSMVKGMGFGGVRLVCSFAYP